MGMLVQWYFFASPLCNLSYWASSPYVLWLGWGRGICVRIWGVVEEGWSQISGNFQTGAASVRMEAF